MSDRGHYVSLMRDLSFFAHPPEDALMGMITAYMDDSGHESDQSHNACVVAGFVGDMAGWNRLERDWPLILRNYGLTHLHMKEHAAHTSLMASSNPEGVPDVLNNLLNLARSSGLRAVANSVRIRDIRKFRQETGVPLSIRALSIYVAMISIWQIYGDREVEVRIDKFEKVIKEINLANQYAQSVEGWDLTDSIILTPAPNSAKLSPALQAADLLAWEARRRHSDADAALRAAHPLLTDDNWRQWFLSHSVERRDNWSKIRPSLRKILTEFPCFGSIVDYEMLMKLHQARGAQWGY